jgi:hypothetical protein
LRTQRAGFGQRAVRRTTVHLFAEISLGTKRTGKGRRKLGRKKRRMRSKIRHRKK